MQSDEKAADYGESDIEAKAMTKASSAEKRPAATQVPGADATTEVSGTAEIDLAENRREKARRASKD